MVAARLPDTFIIGAPKSGTTSLHAYLQEHPDVFMSLHKEPAYFSPDVIGTRPTHRYRYPDDLAEYIALFEQANHELRVGEASTDYLMSKVAPALIRDLQPEPRLIVMLRNPVDLVYSLHAQRIADGAEWITDFGEAFDADDDRRRGLRLPHGLAGLGAAYRDNALLGEQLEHWLKYFGRERFHVIEYDDFARSSELEYGKVLAYLGLDENHRPSDFRIYNPSHRPRRGPAARLLRNGRVRWIARTGLPSVIGHRATIRLSRAFGRRRFAQQRIERPPLPFELRRRLEDEFSDDVRKLGDIVGRDLLSQWFARQPSR
jgi:hypothetical protein